jgi:MATE family multidrug resistance protein
MNRDILRLAIPNIVSNITVPLLGLVELSLMRYIGAEVNVRSHCLGMCYSQFYIKLLHKQLFLYELSLHGQK